MEHENKNELDQEQEGGSDLGILVELGELGSGTIISEHALARLVQRHPVSIKRSVARGELPIPIKLLGQPVWTVGSIVQHIEKRLEDAATDTMSAKEKLEKLMP